jgi:heme/copper-type cytochrome/quinol oxidase subunit 1
MFNLFLLWFGVLARLFRTRRALLCENLDWAITVDHKRLGILYILYALLFLVIGGVEATIMRVQLITAHNHFVSPEVFNRMFTMHGTTMIFLQPCRSCLVLGTI